MCSCGRKPPRSASCRLRFSIGPEMGPDSRCTGGPLPGPRCRQDPVRGWLPPLLGEFIAAAPIVIIRRYGAITIDPIPFSTSLSERRLRGGR